MLALEFNARPHLARGRAGKWPLLIGFVVTSILMVSCGRSMSPTDEYVEALNSMNAEFTPQFEVIWSEYVGKPGRTMDDLQAVLDTDAALRSDVGEILTEVEAPERLSDVHDKWAAWNARLADSMEALAARAGAADSWEGFVNSAEFGSWAAVFADGLAVCNEFETRLDAINAEEPFPDVDWLGDVTRVVHGAIGCEHIPDDMDDFVASLRV